MYNIDFISIIFKWSQNRRKLSMLNRHVSLWLVDILWPALLIYLLKFLTVDQVSIILSCFQMCLNINALAWGRKRISYIYWVCVCVYTPMRARAHTKFHKSNLQMVSHLLEELHEGDCKLALGNHQEESLCTYVWDEFCVVPFLSTLERWNSGLLYSFSRTGFGYQKRARL